VKPGKDEPGMANEAQQNNISPLEHAVTTLLACLSMVKYRTALAEEQRKELITDIETTLQFLRSGLIGGTAMTNRAPNVDREAQRGGHVARKEQTHSLRELYEFYHTYLHMDNGNTPSVLATRFNEAMTIIDEVQQIVEPSGQLRETAPVVSHLGSGPLYQVRAFIADLYYLFVEFMRMLASVLHESDIQVHTEELSTMRRSLKESKEESHIRETQELAPLVGVYEMLQRFYAQKGPLTIQVGEALAFLEYLEEHLDRSVNRRDEVIAQVQKVAQLLNELSHLLSTYERVTVLLLNLS
jgi:hypothetical protein